VPHDQGRHEHGPSRAERVNDHAGLPRRSGQVAAFRRTERAGRDKAEPAPRLGTVRGVHIWPVDEDEVRVAETFETVVIVQEEVGAADALADRQDPLDAQAGERRDIPRLEVLPPRCRPAARDEHPTPLHEPVQARRDLVGDRLVTGEDDHAVASEDGFGRRLEQQCVEQDVVLHEDPEPPSELLDVPVRSGEERGGGAGLQVPVILFVCGVKGEHPTDRGERRSVGMIVQSPDHEVVEPAAVRERPGQPERLLMRRHRDVTDGVVHEVHRAVARHRPRERAHDPLRVRRRAVAPLGGCSIQRRARLLPDEPAEAIRRPVDREVWPEPSDQRVHTLLRCAERPHLEQQVPAVRGVVHIPPLGKREAEHLEEALRATRTVADPMVCPAVIARLEPSHVEVDPVHVEDRDRLLDDPWSALLLIVAHDAHGHVARFVDDRTVGTTERPLGMAFGERAPNLREVRPSDHVDAGTVARLDDRREVIPLQEGALCVEREFGRVARDDP